MFAVSRFVEANRALMRMVWDDVVQMPQSAGFAAVQDARVPLVSLSDGTALLSLATTSAAQWDPRYDDVHFWVDG